MRKIVGIVSFVLAVVVGPSLFAQATRTWVSGVGDDVNPCSRTAPCKTFAGAISKTAAGGEISVLDPGGYGAVTITKSITINGAGTLASILFSQTNGVVINGTDIVVNLVDLSLNGGTPSSPGLNGIRIIAAAHVSVSNCDIFNYSQNGITDERTVAGSLTVKNTRIHNSIPFGSNLTRTGIRIGPAAGSAVNEFTCDGCTIFGNEASNSLGIFMSAGAIGTITRSSITGNVRGLYIVNGSVAVEETQIFGNSYGVKSGGGGTVRLSQAIITNNAVEGLEFSGGVIASFGNNRIAGNGGNNGAGLTALGQQ